MITPERITQFVKSVGHGIREGWPVRDHRRVEELFSICAACPHFVAKSRRNGHCDLCGCIIAGDRRSINKLRFAWESCPAGKWDAETGVPPVKGKCSGCQ